MPEEIELVNIFRDNFRCRHLIFLRNFLNLHGENISLVPTYFW